MSPKRTVEPRDAGMLSLELAVLTPALLLLIGLLVVAGRVSLGGGAVEQAAAAAARQASISRTAGEARTSANDAARTTLDQQGLQCSRISVSVDTGGFAAPVGAPAHISATVTCVVLLSDIGIPGLPGSRTVTSTALSPLDTYRER